MARKTSQEIAQENLEIAERVLEKKKAARGQGRKVERAVTTTGERHDELRGHTPPRVIRDATATETARIWREAVMKKILEGGGTIWQPRHGG